MLCNRGILFCLILILCGIIVHLQHKTTCLTTVPAPSVIVTPSVVQSTPVFETPSVSVTPPVVQSSPVFDFAKYINNEKSVSYTVSPEEEQPSDACVGQKRIHPFDFGRAGLLNIVNGNNDVRTECAGPNFTDISVRDEKIYLNLSRCLFNPQYGATPDKIDSKWAKVVQLPLEKVTGVHWAYTSCADPLFGKPVTNFRIIPYKTDEKTDVETSEKRSVLILYIDSLSHRRFQLDMPNTYRFLSKYKHTQVFSYIRFW